MCIWVWFGHSHTEGENKGRKEKKGDETMEKRWERRKKGGKSGEREKVNNAKRKRGEVK